MSFKIIILSTLLVSSTYGFRFFHIFDDPVEVAPQTVCTGVADGSKVADDTDCGHFYLCDGGASLRLPCRSAEPYFDRCLGICVSEMSVCTKTDCAESTTVTTTETSTVTSTVSATQTSTQVSTESTTKFIPPTVPNVCPTDCAGTYDPATCKCPERWVCENEVCVCNSKITCPMPLEQCELEENCGCADRCECDANDACLCKENHESIQCSFNDTAGECLKNCGCENNCECTDPTAKTGCTCKATCACIEPPKVCPFKPADCVASCGCESRCICNGDFCTCDANVACAGAFWKRH